jgi:hypothetical protein
MNHILDSLRMFMKCCGICTLAHGRLFLRHAVQDKCLGMTLPTDNFMFAIVSMSKAVYLSVDLLNGGSRSGFESPRCRRHFYCFLVLIRELNPGLLWRTDVPPRFFGFGRLEQLLLPT